jgi:type 1 glutamine amidotransferase
MSHKLLVSLGFLALSTAVAAAQEGKTPRFKNVSSAILKKIEAALPDKAPAMPKAPRKVLIYSRTNGFRHGSIPVGVAALTLMGEKTGAYTAVHTEDASYFEPAKLKEFDAVIMLNTTGDVFAPKQIPDFQDAHLNDAVRKLARKREEELKKSLVDFVKRGGGLAGMHAATDTYHRWSDYRHMMGGTFDGHPWHKAVPVKNLAPDHPLNQVFHGNGFEVVDEIYQFQPDTALPNERRMLLALDTTKMDVSKGKRKDGLYPISWVSTYGKGHTFYCSLGHNDHIYFNPAILRHYLAGIQYAVGDLSADATPTPVK